MTLRVAQFVLVSCLAIYYTLLVLNNITDYDSNYQFVRHVLMMDSTFPGNHLMWRAVHSATLQTMFYLAIIGWECVTMTLIWMGATQMGQHLRGDAPEFNDAKRWAIIGLTLSAAMWLLAFLTVGGEWFLMWQSQTWNGQDAAFRMFCVVGLVLLTVAQRDDRYRA